MKNRPREEEAARLQEEKHYVLVDESSDDQSLLEDEGFLVLDVPRNEPSSPSNGQEKPQVSPRKKLMELEQHLKNVTQQAESLTKYLQAIREKLSESETEEAMLKSRRKGAADETGRLCTELNALSLKSQFEKLKIPSSKKFFIHHKSRQHKIKKLEDAIRDPENAHISASEAHQQIKVQKISRSELERFDKEEA